jgi:hypothetical protein
MRDDLTIAPTRRTANLIAKVIPGSAVRGSQRELQLRGFLRGKEHSSGRNYQVQSREIE